MHTASGPLSTRHRNRPKVSACKYPLENGTASSGVGEEGESDRVGAGRWPRRGGSEAASSPGKRRKPSEFFIGKNSIREREVPVFVIGHPREGRRRAGGACPAQRYPLIQGMVDRERYHGSRIPSLPSSLPEASTMFLSCGRYQRNQLPGNTREFRTPSPAAAASCPRSGKREVYRGGWGVEGGGSRKGAEGGTPLAVAHIYFILAAPYRPGTDGILYQVAPQARRTPPFSFAAIDGSVPPLTTIDAHPEFPLFFTFHFHGINIDFRVMTKRCRIEIREFEYIIKGHENVSMYV